MDLRGFGETDPEPVDVTRGLGDYADDLAAVIEARTARRPRARCCLQTRALLDGYAAAGGRYREVVIEDSGHGPHLDQPARFRAALTEHLAQA